MAFNPMLEAEPYEESQVGSPRSGLSSLPEAEAMRQFYEDQERKEIERKLSKRNSGRSPRRTRMSVRRSTSDKRRPQQQPTQHFPPPQPVAQISQAQQSRTTLMDSRESLLEKSDNPTPLVRSLIPDLLHELPSWYAKDQLVSPVNPIIFRQRYPIHNANAGPRFYRNHHLTAPKGLVRPSSFFSPSFPPMTSSHTRSQDSAQLSTRTPSGTPLPTPQSSQTGIADLGRRSRKNSQNAPDNVDLLDVTDPSGKNWHHTSPYDLNISNGASATPDVLDPPRARLASSATTRASRANKVPTPSPLSQSTSALHVISALEDDKPARKLSKRRPPVLGNFFGAPKQPKPRTASLPSSPMNPNEPTRVALHDPPVGSSNRKHTSAIPMSASAIELPSKGKERRGSMLGRLVKKFSLLRRPAASLQERTGSANGTWHHVSPDDVPSSQRPSLNEHPSGIKSPRRIPPPAEDTAPTPEPDRRSSVSVEVRTRGPLTVANPDVPSPPATRSNTTLTPAHRPITLESGILEQIHFNNEPTKDIDTKPVVTNAPPPSTASIPPSRRATTPTQRPTSPPTDAMPKRSSRSTVRSSRSTVRESAQIHSTASVDQESTPKPKNTHLHTIPDRSLPPTPMLAESRPLSMATSAGDRPISISSTAVNPPASLAYYEESPLSTSSMIVNPPTPYGPMANISPSSPEPMPSRIANGTSGQKISSVTAKETETFKLVRRQSGHLDINGDQWEVVEASQGNKHEKEKAKPSEKERNRSGEKEKKGSPKKLSKSRSEARPSSQIRDSSSSSSQRHNGRESPRKSDRRSEDSKSRRESSATSLKSGEHVKMNGGAQLDRGPSQASRPISELPSAAEMNGVRAREAYDLERLWKAQTMYNSNNLGPGPRYIPSDGSSPIPGSMRTIHGSSHTSYSVSSPFASTTSLSAVHPVQSHYTPHSQRTNMQNFSSSRAGGAPFNARIMNRLPAPPQESPYQSPLLTDSKWLATTAH